MSRKRRKSTRRQPTPSKTVPPGRASAPLDPYADARTGKQWPYRSCDFESFGDDHPRAAELQAAETERIYLNAANAGVMTPGLAAARATARSAARLSLQKRGETVPAHLAETPDERAVVAQMTKRWCAEFNELRAGTRSEFEARGWKVPDFLQHQEPAGSLEEELSRATAHIVAVHAYTANVRAETARLRAQAVALREQFDSTPAGKEVLRLRSERRQIVSDILQADADIARENRNADLLLSFVDHYIGKRPPNLPPPQPLSRYSTDFEFLTEQCRSLDFDVPAGIRSIAALSASVRAQVPPSPRPAVKPESPEAAPPAAKKSRRVVVRRIEALNPNA